MESCQCIGIKDYYDAQEARNDLKRYRKNGPDPTTQVLIDALTSEGVTGLSLLDIGGGIGVRQLDVPRNNLVSTVEVA